MIRKKSTVEEKIFLSNRLYSFSHVMTKAEASYLFLILYTVIFFH